MREALRVVDRSAWIISLWFNVVVLVILLSGPVWLLLGIGYQ